MTLAFSSDQLQMIKHKALLTLQKVDEIVEGKIVATQDLSLQKVDEIEEGIIVATQNTQIHASLTVLFFAQCCRHILHAVALHVIVEVKQYCSLPGDVVCDEWLTACSASLCP